MRLIDADAFKEYLKNAFEEVKHMYPDGGGFARQITEDFCRDIDEQPTINAEPERLTDDDFETIRIHLNAYKEKLCNQHRWKEAEEYQRIIDRFMAFASAQPDSQPTCNNLATDLISRQVAIDAVNKIAPVNTEYDCRLLDILDVRYVLTELPSAEKAQLSEEDATSVCKCPCEYREPCDYCHYDGHLGLGCPAEEGLKDE